MINNEFQREHPFGKGEPRFHYEKTDIGISNGNDISYKRKINYNYTKDNLEGGLGYFYNKPLNKFSKKNNNNINYKYLNRFINTNRVINPSENKEPEQKRHKRACNSIENKYKLTNGNILSLINKTPINFPFKGKKRLNVSMDKSTNMFSKEFLYDSQYNKLFGVERKGKGFRGNSIENKNILSNSNRNGKIY
jgi:hypothetical protein